MFSFALGIGTQNQQQEWLEVFYPAPLLKPSQSLLNAVDQFIGTTNASGIFALLPEHCGRLAELLSEAGASAQATLAESLSLSEKPLLLIILAQDQTINHVAEAYLKLQLLSHRLVKPQQINLDNLFNVLKNIAWTNQGPIDLQELPQRQLAARLANQILTVDCIDKFPKMTDYVVPDHVRIADCARVRLGAYLGAGTTIMHEGFCNFNAGTEGPAMIEGRISAGVMIGAHSDLGGGSSLMGTLSGGGNMVIAVGENCLIGANSGCGIPLGDRCIIEAGLYVTASSKITLIDENNQAIKVVRARELAHQNDLLFWRNSQTGRLECRNHQRKVSLNTLLHQQD